MTSAKRKKRKFPLRAHPAAKKPAAKKPAAKKVAAVKKPAAKGIAAREKKLVAREKALARERARLETVRKRHEARQKRSRARLAADRERHEARQKRSRAATKGWKTRRLRIARDRVLGGRTEEGPMPEGKDPNQMIMLVGLKRTNATAWRRFLAYATEVLDCTYSEACDEWFSPEM